VINKSLRGTSVEDFISNYSEYYRWRLMTLEPKTTYSIHSDGLPGNKNLRLHLPLQTNSQSFLCFYDRPVHSGSQLVHHYNLLVNNVYEVNTTGLHTAVNYGNNTRYHLVGVRYESSINRPYPWHR